MRGVAIFASAWLLLAPAARGDDRAEAPAPALEARARDDGRRTLRRFPSNLLRSAGGVFHGDNLGPLIAGGTATAAASFFDGDVADYIADPEHGFGKSLEDGAAPEVLGVSWPASSPPAVSSRLPASGR